MVKKASISAVLSDSVFRILRPLVRILLKQGIPFGSFADLAKQAYVEVAEKEFRIGGRKQSISRISVITGLTRKEAQRILELPATEDRGTVERYNRAARVISGWVRDGRFHDSKGKPTPLRASGKGKSFGELVKRYSGDVPARAVLDELERVGAVEISKDGRVNLLTRAYVPSSGEADKMAILGTDVSDLITTIEHNLDHAAEYPRFQRKVSYDNLPREAISKLRTLSFRKSQKLLEELDRWMSERDRDVNPQVDGTGRARAGIGIYYFEEELDEED